MKRVITFKNLCALTLAVALILSAMVICSEPVSAASKLAAPDSVKVSTTILKNTAA